MNRVKNSISRRLLAWYDGARRDLPWRAAPGQRPDPYHVLVSEAMLQQTQVRTVIPYFQRFISKLPTIQHLANAGEQVVLRLWQGLGYHSRARNLRRAAQAVVAEHGGVVPSDPEVLMELPGIGRYTAGAIASIAHNVPAPIVDGNVARVLCRLDAIETPLVERATQVRLWTRAAQLVPRRRAGDFNSALMELGATVCTPRWPQCLICPLRNTCRAAELGIQDRIPAPRAAREVPLVERHTYCVRRGSNGNIEWMIEQRPPKGRWAAMWQFVTTKEDSASISPGQVPELTCLKLSKPCKLGTIEHSLTHRRYRFHVYLCDLRGRRKARNMARNHKWVRLDELESYPLPRPHVRIAEILRSC